MVAKNALLFAALLASSMLFAGMGDWDGKLFINGALAADGTQVCAYVNGVENSRTTIGAYATGFYLMTIVGETGDNVTFNAFCDSQFPANEGTQAWAASPPRHHLNLTIDYDSTVGNSSNITSNGTGNLTITVNGTTPGVYYNEVLPVNISSSSGVVLSFNFDFSNDSLNLSTINISVGNSSGASYISVSGVNASGGQSGTKTLKMYNVSATYNGICVEDVENATYQNISAACTGTNEVQVPCPGTASGITCAQSGTTVTISGLSHSAVMQFSIPATTTTTTTTTSSGGGGGTGGAGGGSSGSNKASSDYAVDIGNGKSCNVSVSRALASDNNLSKLTTTLTNAGGSECTMTEFVFTDTVSDLFAAMNEITFSQQPASQVGWQAQFNFPSFAPGESKTLSYSVARWARPSSVNNFTIYTMSAKKQVAAPPAPQQNITPPKKEEPTPPKEAPVVTTGSQQQAIEKPAAAAPKNDGGLLSGAVLGIIGIGVLGVIVAVAYLVFVRKKKRGL